MLSQSPGDVAHPIDESEPYDLVVRNIGRIVTFGPEAVTGDEMMSPTVIENAAIGCNRGRFTFIGHESKLDRERIGSDTTVVDARGKAVVPGLVDPHTHLVFAGTREFELEMKLAGKSYMDILASGGGIMYTVGRTREATSEELFWEAWDRLNIMLMNGTTTAEAKSGYGLDRETEIKMLEVSTDLGESHPIDIVNTYLGPHAVPDEYDDGDEYIDFVIDTVLPEVCNRELATFADIFCERGVFDAAQAERYLKAAKRHGLIPKIHTDEIENIGGSQVAARVGAISADHLAVTTDEDIEALRKAGVTGVLMPATPYALMASDAEYPRARDMIDAGLTVALGTDLNPNCYSPSMQFAMSLACYKMKMHPMEALAAATINAAHAIGLEEEVGCIMEYRKADFIILNGKNPAVIPYHIGMNSVNSVVKNGDLVVYDGKLMV